MRQFERAQRRGPRLVSVRHSLISEQFAASSEKLPYLGCKNAVWEPSQVQRAQRRATELVLGSPHQLLWHPFGHLHRQ